MAKRKPITRAQRASRPTGRSVSYRSHHTTQTSVIIKYSFSKKSFWYAKQFIKTIAVFLSGQKTLSLPKPTLPALDVSISLKREVTTTPEVANTRTATERRLHRLRLAGLGVFMLLSLTGSITGGVYAYEEYVKDLPAPTELRNRNQNLTTKITDRSGTLLYEVYQDENRTLIPLSELPPHLIHATIAIEDKHFYEHYGIDVQGILRAFRANQDGTAVQGGSTITQQLVKKRLLSPEKTLKRKIREAILSVLVESQYTKEEILEMYFNQIPYGGSTYGVEAAAQRYFGKSARAVTLSEAAFLAGLPAAPSIYNPFGSTPELAHARQREVLRRMSEDGYITPDQAQAAMAEKLAFKAENINIKAPHFVMYVRELLAEKYGEEVVNKGGLEVTTTLDLALHEATQKQVSDEVKKLNRLKISNGAAMVTNPKTGEVLSMVGSTDYFDFAHDGQVNVTRSLRQPGSSIKPLTYALALERGFTPASLLEDTPVRFLIEGAEPYVPKNYDGRFHGMVSLRQSLASSYNIPAVRLLNAIGLNTMIDKALDIGITSWNDRSRFGLALTLGGGEVRMTDMMQLYGTFANNGYTMDLNPILEVKNQYGQVLYRNTCALEGKNCDAERNLDPLVAYQITSILSDNQARSPAFGLHSVLHIPNQDVAVKTGTTNSMRDNWTFGYTSDRVVGVWVGNNDNTPMSYVASGITGASPIWNNIMRLNLSETTPHRFAEPTGLIKVAMCGKNIPASCGGCSDPKNEYFLPGTEPTDSCLATTITDSVHSTQSSNEDSEKPRNNRSNSRRSREEKEVTNEDVYFWSF